MAGVSALIDESPNSFYSPFVTRFRHPKDSSVEDSVSVLTEVMLNTQDSRPPLHSLKRKRGLKIQIPPVLQPVQTPKLVCREKAIEDEAVGYDASECSVFCKKGKKKLMEDTHKIVSQLHGDAKKGFFGVYDGHGGRKAAEFVAENLHCYILGMLEKCEGDVEKEEAIKAGYLKTDQEFLKQGLSSGTCCVTALIEQGDVVVSNLGDCRAVLCRGGVAEALTIDHKAGREDERNRIEEKGGYVGIHHGAWRVQGTLSVSRSIGDSHLKEWVLAEPHTKILPLTSDMEFLILASDGLWDKVSNQEAIDTVYSHSDFKCSGTGVNSFKENDDVFGSENSPPSKVSNQEAIDTVYSHSDFKCSGTGVNSFKENDDVFGSENSPPSKVRRTSLNVQQQKRKQCPNQDNSDKKRSTSSKLVVACKELVSLAAMRGSLDDITVMIIDLKHFHCS